MTNQACTAGDLFVQAENIWKVGGLQSGAANMLRIKGKKSRDF